MGNQEKTNHSKADLLEFENLILEKLKIAHQELDSYKDMMIRKGDGGTSGTTGVYHSLENGAESNQKEEIATLAGRQKKFILSLENALLRIKNGTYGVCFKSGKLISKARLLAVPTTTQCIEEKLKQYK
jgi:RNA polymerase-binding transcription factor DksA